MFEIKKNKKNKSAVILNPERSEWVSRSHVTSVEPVVNDRVKTKRYSAKRDLYGDFAYAQPLKMTALAFLLSLNISESLAAWSDNCPSGTTAGTTCKTCGDNCAYTENSEHVVTIYGSGIINYDWKNVNGKNGYYDANNNPNPFYNNTSITGVQFAEGSNFTSIGKSAFSGASSLTSITIPKGVTSIGLGAFGYATSLTSITLPDSLTSIGDYAFYDASSLTSITIPEGVTSIGWSAFEGASSLTSITIPDSLTSIEAGAFRNATGLTSITIPEGVTSIGDFAFYGASSLESITIPEGVTSIGDNAFYGASSLTSITIPEGVTSIGYAAFVGASSLTSITIPDSVTSIGDGAFYKASSLTSITIPEGVTSIGANAFDGTGLTSITIPEGVTSIGWGAFSGANSLTSIMIPDNINTEGWDSSAFNGLSASANIVCQGGLNTCYEKLAKYFSADDPRCPANATCNCSRGCIDSSRISEATSASQCTGNYGWSGAGCSRKNADGSVDCASGFVEWENQCLSEYPFAKKRWTPAEAAQWLHDGNDNFVVITFKK